MKIECPECNAVHKIDESKIPDKGAYARCRECKARFFVEKKKESPEPPRQAEETKKCPKCGHEGKQTDDSCSICGIIYKKYEEKTKCPNRKCQAERNPKDEKCPKCGLYYNANEDEDEDEDDNTNKKIFKFFACTAALIISAVHPGAFWLTSWVIAALFISQKTKSKVTALGGGFIASCVMFIIFANITGMEKTSHKKNPTITEAKRIKEWYQNGSLHRSSVAEWKSATYENKLATASDWAINSSKIKEKVMKSGSMDTLKPFAAELVTCVNNAASGQGYGNTKTIELAATCMVLMGW